MKEKLLIASDYDGTFGDGEQLTRDVEAVERFRAAGNIFGLVSGRNAAALRYVQSADGIGVDFLLSDSGGNCQKDGRILFCVLSPSEVMLPLCHYLMARDTKLIAVNRADGADMIYYRHSDGSEEYAPRRALWTERPFTGVSGYFSTVEKCIQTAREIETIFPRLTALPNGRCLDVIPRGSGKDAGTLRTAGLFGVKKENIYTIGDNYNDLPMIRAFNGFAVENAAPGVGKQAPCGVVPSVEALIDRLLEAFE